MINEYILEGLNCANCAAKIQKDIEKQDGILEVSINLINGLLRVETEETHEGNITKMVERIVHKYEPDVIVSSEAGQEQQTSKAHSHDHSHHSHDIGSKNSGIIKMIVGAIIFAAGIFLENIMDINYYITLSVFIASYLILGGDVIWRAIRNIARGQIFDENFLMGIATIGAFLTGNVSEAVAVMLFYQIGEYFQETAVRKSRKSISDLMGIRPDYANLKKDKEMVRVAPDTVKVGDIIIVKPGEKIPLDGVVLEGESMLDTMALTGESTPRKASISDLVLSGCINQSGVLTIEVTKTFGESTVAKIIDLVENASSKKASTENFITTFSRYYTPAVVGLAALLAVIPPLFFGGIWSDWINRGLVFLVISCPCALVVSIPLGFFGGIGGASKNGILIKGGNYLEALNKLEIVVFDKTGTLTQGVFEVTNSIPAINFREDELLKAAAKAEIFSNHPIATSIKKAYSKDISEEHITDYAEIPGHGVRAVVEGKKVLAGNGKLMQAEHIPYEEVSGIGTKIYVAIDHIYAGCIVISDKIKKDSLDAIMRLKEKGIRKTVMLTGDNSEIAGMIAEKLKLDEVYAGLLPDQKVEKVEMLNSQKREKGKLAFVGDGINDAPVLARADIGIAMGGLGSDAAIEAADVVLMTDEPSKLIDAINIAKYTKRIVWQNIVFALGVKGLFLLFGAFGIATMWEAVFADVGVAVLAILNAMRVIRRKW